MGFTGYLLPWDQTAYWASAVGINLNGTAPFLGPWLAQFLAGGPEIGSDTLPKFYAMHMLLIPGALIALIGIHIYLVTRLGVSSPPWSSEAAGRERPPDEADRRARGARARERRRRLMARDLGELNREDFARYKDDVKKEGKPFFPRAIFHDTVMSLDRRLRDHRARGIWYYDARRRSSRGFSGRGTRSRPIPGRRASFRARTGTSTSSSTSSGSSSGRRRSSSPPSASRRSA